MHRFLFAVGLSSFCALLYSSPIEDTRFSHPLYAGGALGYGSTTWYGLVPAAENQNMAMALYTPVSAQEGGLVWGGLAGYELSPNFSIEVNYQQYPKVNLTFDEESLYAYDNDSNTLLSSQTEVVFVLAKIMLVIPNSAWRVYSGVGIGDLHRNDLMNNHWLITPSFGAGVNYTPTKHISTELAANYTAGYGESELNPVADYMPFLYSVCVKLIYRI